MPNINLGGYKKSNKFSQEVRARWKIMDIDPKSDFIYDINSQKPFPFEDNSVDNFYTSMTLEHVFPENMFFVLSELHRTLKYDGKIRIVVPDIEIGISMYIDKDKNIYSKEMPTPDDSFPPTYLGALIGWFYTEDKFRKEAMRSGHHMAFDWETLHYYLNKTNFKKIIKLNYMKKSPVFEGKDFERYKDWALYVEASK